eukprot:jgi/Chrzof1/5817/Cz16g16270.t1
MAAREVSISDVSGTEGDELTDDESEVQQTVGLLHRLQRENRDLTQNFENLKALHLQLGSVNKQLSTNFDALHRERVSVEQQYQQLCESWRAELEEKQKQFEQARSQMLQPRDVDVLRVQLLEEIEGPFKAKCDMLAQEAEAAQEQFVRLRREHESLQATHKAMEVRHETEIATLTAEHQAVVAALKGKLLGQEHAQGDTMRAEQQLRGFKRAEEEANSQVRHLKDEIQDLRREKEAAVVDKEQAMIRADRRMKQLQVEVNELHSLVESLTRKNRHLQSELNESSRVQETMHSQLITLQGSNSSLASQLADAKAVAAREHQLLLDKHAAAERHWEHKVNDLLTEVLQKDRQLSEVVASHDSAMRQLQITADERVAVAEAAAAEHVKEATAKQTEWTAKLQEAEAAVAGWQRQAIEYQDQCRLEVAAARQEAATAQYELSNYQKFASNLQQQLQEANEEITALKSSVLQLEEFAGPGITSKTQTEARCASVEQHSQQLEAQNAELASELADLRSQYNSMRAELDQRLAASKQQWTSEKEALLHKHAEQVRKLKEAAREQVKALKNRVKAYKSSIAALHSEVTGVKLALHEKESDLAVITRLSERPMSAGSPGRPYSLSSPVPPPSKSVAAAIADVRHRQGMYLQQLQAA